RDDLVLGELDVRLEVDRAADVVDEDVDPAEVVAGSGHRGRGAYVPLQIGGERDCLRALARELLGDLVHELGAVHQGDRAPLPGRPGGYRLPETLCRASDDQGLTVETSGE